MKHLILSLIFSLIFFSCTEKATDPPEEEENFPDAINFTVVDADNVPFSLTDYAGKVIILNFFATWCAPCQLEMPQLESNIWQTYNQDEVIVIGVDMLEDIGIVKLFSINTGITFRLGIDQTGDVFTAYSGGTAAANVPYNVIIDKNMKIRFSQTGYDEPAMIALIDELIQ